MCRATGDVSPLASCRVPAILALEDSSRTATDAGSAASADSPDGPGQPDVGTGAHCQRTTAQARSAGLAAYRAQIYAHHLGRGPGTRVPSQRWATFVRNHAQAILACDCCVAITATFRLLYVFEVIDHASRQLLRPQRRLRPHVPLVSSRYSEDFTEILFLRSTGGLPPSPRLSDTPPAGAAGAGCLAFRAPWRVPTPSRAPRCPAPGRRS